MRDVEMIAKHGGDSTDVPDSEWRKAELTEEGMNYIIGEILASRIEDEKDALDTAISSALRDARTEDIAEATTHRIRVTANLKSALAENKQLLTNPANSAG